MSSAAPSSLDNQISALQARLVELQKARRAEQLDADKRIAESQSRNTLSAHVQQRLERCESSLVALLMEVKLWVSDVDPASEAKTRDTFRRVDVVVLANMYGFFSRSAGDLL